MELKDYVEWKEQQMINVATQRAYTTSQTRDMYFRNDADIDYARVLYSSACRRLQGKMQLFIPRENSFYRNRLTHSLEVSQIARSLAKKIGLKDILTVQTCSMAHDTGNPPFGHAGEKFLSSCSSTSSYEGNAQTFRVLTHLEEKHYDYNGLNLTIRTLLGVVKYFHNQQENPKKFLYDKDFETVSNWVKEHNINMRTIDCEVMDIADEIAYAAHDLEDSLKNKYFSIGELLYEFQVSKYKNVYEKFASIVKQARDFANNSTAYKSSEEYSILFRKELTSIIVNSLIMDVDLVEGPSGSELGYKELSNLARGLKSLTFTAIKRNPEIIEYELIGKHVLTNLYTVYMDNTFNKDLVLLPAEYRDTDDWERTVIDYIGGMMDSYAISQYEKYFGKLKDTGIYKHPVT
ncbi:deoxyguanosinetriphosphate triphosphohydrolase family protein [Spirosoma sp.]|uniref:deoxyguanosinetriphosphate triphosphohydrolase family protein n=1 Tax=Spirosoma sp. TaxID=1899569 RepID=UPI003B3BBFAD